MVRFRSDDFERDPYGFWTNQEAHISLGIRCGVWFCFVIFVFFDAFPYKEAALVTLPGLYLGYELARQGWQGWDTLEDTRFFTWGVVVVYVPFNEMRAGSPDFTGSLETAMILVVVTFADLSRGFALRLWRRDGARIRATWAGPGGVFERVGRIWRETEF